MRLRRNPFYLPIVWILAAAFGAALLRLDSGSVQGASSTQEIAQPSALPLIPVDSVHAARTSGDRVGPRLGL